MNAANKTMINDEKINMMYIPPKSDKCCVPFNRVSTKSRGYQRLNRI
jgi:hypothetical protein